MTSFSRQKPLKSKIQKRTIYGKTKFYYRAKSQLKRLKIEKLVWKRSLFDDSWPGVSRSSLMACNSETPQYYAWRQKHNLRRSELFLIFEKLNLKTIS